MFEESQIAHSAAGKEIDRLRRRVEDLLRELRRHNNDRAKVEALIVKESDRPGVTRIQDIRTPANSSRITQRSNAIENISCATELKQRLKVRSMRFKVFKEIYRQQKTL